MGTLVAQVLMQVQAQAQAQVQVQVQVPERIGHLRHRVLATHRKR